jgi:hypothetical protein
LPDDSDDRLRMKGAPGPWPFLFSLGIASSLACLADTSLADGKSRHDELLYVCTAGICTNFLPPATVSCPIGTILVLTDCSEANYRAALGSDFGLLSEANVTIRGGGATVVLDWSAQRHSPYSAVLAQAPASSYPLYWVVALPPSPVNMCEPSCAGGSLESIMPRYSWERLNRSTLSDPSNTISRIYPGASATASPQYASADAACRSGFAYLQRLRAEGTWIGAEATYNNGTCLLRVGITSIGFLPIHSFPTPPSMDYAPELEFVTEKYPGL